MSHKKMTHFFLSNSCKLIEHSGVNLKKNVNYELCWANHVLHHSHLIWYITRRFTSLNNLEKRRMKASLEISRNLKNLITLFADRERLLTKESKREFQIIKFYNIWTYQRLSINWNSNLTSAELFVVIGTEIRCFRYLSQVRNQWATIQVNEWVNFRTVCKAAWLMSLLVKLERKQNSLMVLEEWLLLYESAASNEQQERQRDGRGKRKWGREKNCVRIFLLGWLLLITQSS